MSSVSLIQRVQRSQFLRNVLKISSGRIIAMAIAVVATPIVSRLFEPEHYGIAALLIASIGILASIMPLSYERAVLFPKEKDTAIELLAIALAISTAIAVCAYLVLGVSALVMPDIGSSFGFDGYLWFVPIGALLLAVKTTAGTACIRCKYFSSIASADVAEAAVAATIRIGWGLLIASSAIGLILGYASGLIVAAIIVGLPVWRWASDCDVNLSGKNIRRRVIEFRDYPIFRAPAKFAFSGAQRLPVIALGIIFPAEIVGFYAMANRAAAMPLHAASQAVKDVLLQKIMKRRQDEIPIVRSLSLVAVALAVTGAPIFLILFLFGEELLSWFLSARWASAGGYVEILSPYLYTVWVGSFTATIFETLRLNKLRLRIHVGNFLIRLLIFTYCGISGFNVETTLWVFVAISCLYQFLIYAVAARAAYLHDGSLSSGEGQDKGCNA